MVKRKAKWNPARLGILVAAIATLSACQGLPGVPRAYSPTFKVEALADGPAALGTSAGSTAVEVAGVAPANAGKLVVQFGHLLPKAEARRLMATIADVETITITLSGNGVSHTETIPKAAIVNGATSFTFTGLPPGALTVTIKALNASNAVIGQDIQQATVTAGQTTVVTSTVSLVPSVPTPRVIVGSSGGGSGGATGTLTANVTLRDGIPVIAAPIRAVYAPTTADDPEEAVANAVVLDNQGNAWFSGDFAQTQAYPWRLSKVTPADAQTYVNGPPNHEWWYLGVSPDGGRILLSGLTPHDTTDLGVATDGTAVAAAGNIASALQVVQAPDGSVYYRDHGDSLLGLHQRIHRVAPDGTASIVWDSAVGTGGTPYDLACDHAGNPVALIFVMDGTPEGFHYALKKFQPDGTLVFSRDYPASYFTSFAIDGQDDIWVVDPSRGMLDELSGAGQLRGSYPTPARCNSLYIDASDRVWAYQSSRMPPDRFPIPTSGADTDVITRFSPAGVLQAYYQVGKDADTEQIAVSADDHLWVASKKKGLIHLKLDPLP